MSEERKKIIKFVNQKLYLIKENLDESGARAQLAKMRHGLGKMPGESPELWGLLFDNLPEELMGRNTEPSKAEQAIYVIFTLYALHQQGKSLKEQNVNQQGIGFGQAVASLAVRSEKSIETIRSRFNATVLSSDLIELAWHMKSMIQLLKQKDIGLDYGLLAEDFYGFQFPDSMSEIRLKWGRDFYKYINEATKKEEV